jgi:hypothetical protein
MIKISRQNTGLTTTIDFSVVMVYILPCMFLVLLGKTLAWTLFWVYQEPTWEGIEFLLLLIDSPKWHILYHVIKRWCFPHSHSISGKLWDCMACPRRLFQTMTPSFWVTFGRSCGQSSVQGCCFPLFATLKRMGKLKFWIEYFLCCYEHW